MAATISERTRPGGKVGRMLILYIAAIALNVAGIITTDKTGIPLYLDSAGTILACALGGGLPGITVSFVTNFIGGLVGVQKMYYGVLNMMVAAAAAFFAKKGFFRDTVEPIIMIPVFVAITGGLHAVLTWFLNGCHIGGRGEEYVIYVSENSNLGLFMSQLVTDLLIDLADKTIIVIFVIVVIKILPNKLLDKYDRDCGRVAAKSDPMEAAIRRSECRSMSLRTKIMLILIAALVLIAGTSTVISFMLFRNTTIEEHVTLAEGLTGVAANSIDPEKVYQYMTNGESEPGYRETEDMLYKLKESSPDVEYVYVYRISEDGCHVVFDLDTDDLEGSEPGEVIPFDESFKPYIPALLAGEEIEPIISKDTYGWLLTVYKPVYDALGKCRCYVAVDISMNVLTEYGYSFLAKLLSLFVGFFIITVAVTTWIIERNMIRPVNAMAYCAGAFAYNSDAALEKSLERIKSLDIRTGDEIENLYHAFTKTTCDSMEHAVDIQRKTKMIAEMQNGLIMVLADLVESRDKCTGDHVRKTAAYVKIIVEEMKKRGYYADQLTDEFMQNVIDSAPLHDVGKIHIPDRILNKPGKLTDAEFDTMKTHTTVGGEIIDRVIEMVPESGYLQEARNLAEYHHEKWNGKGYPHGLRGEDIPLSARIMAVADVFDALVSRRSYKQPFTFEKAMSIIREDAGTHFDPLVADAFIAASDKVRAVAEEFDSMNGPTDE